MRRSPSSTSSPNRQKKRLPEELPRVPAAPFSLKTGQNLTSSYFVLFRTLK